MGTVLSFSPTASKGGLLDDGNVIGNEGTVKRQSMFVSALTWKKLVSASSKKKCAKKVSPDTTASQVSNNQVDQLNHENHKKSIHPSEPESKVKAPLAVPVPTVPTQNLQPSQADVVNESGKLSSIKKQPSRLSVISPRRVIIQASTGELLRCLGDFVCRRCYKLKDLSSGEVILWFRNIDRTLLLQGWQDIGFITPANLVFVYLICKGVIKEDIDSTSELQGTFLSCLYLAYSYMGNEISYPLKPFIIEANKDVFWDTSLYIIDKMSGEMLQLNTDPHFFTEVFQDLKEEGERDNNVDR